MVDPIPEGYTPVTPHVVVQDGAAAIDFYVKAFGAEELVRLPGPTGEGIIHAEIAIGGAVIMLAEEMPGMEYWLPPTSIGGTSVVLALYTADCDALFQRAVDAGCQVVFPPTDMFWGDRYARVRDPFGHEWSLATHTADLTPEQIMEGQKAFFEQMGPDGCGPEG